ncbi:MAG: hypothetical protein AAF846_17145 [Chloroflexota bacterium]
MLPELPEVVDRAILLTHVLAGCLTLLSGFASMWTDKGGKNHRRWGKVFFWSMFTIFITSLGTIFLFRFNPFLLGVNILSFYVTFTGYRVTYRKRGANGQNANWIDWTAVGLATIGGIFLIIWGAMVMLGYTEIAWSPTFGILGIVLGFFILQNAIIEDARAFRRPVADRRWWWYYHMERMLSGMIGAVTALTVQQLGSLAVLGNFSWIPWVLPGVIGGFGIAYWIRLYRRRFATARKRA